MTQDSSYSSSFGGYGNYTGQGEPGHHGTIQVKGSAVNYKQGDPMQTAQRKSGPKTANQN